MKNRSESRESTRSPAPTKAKVKTTKAKVKTLGIGASRCLKIGRQITVDVEVEGLPVVAVIDTGSPVSIVSSVCLSNVHQKLVGPEGDWKESVRRSE